MLRFLHFEFDVGNQKLSRRGHRVRMSASQVKLLTLFLARPGELITKDEIVAHVWTDTSTINITKGVHMAINRLRVSLGDKPEKPLCIETVIGLGYRFIAPVERILIESEPQEASEAESQSLATGQQAGEPAAQEELKGERPEERSLEVQSSEAGAIDMVPLLAVATDLIVPAASSKKVRREAALWLPISLVAVAVLLILTGPMALRSIHNREPVMVAASLVASWTFNPITSDRDENKVTAEAISPDGESLVYADGFGLSIHNFAQKADTSLAALPASVVTRISWYPDEREVLLSTTDPASGQSSLRLVPISGAYTRVLATDAGLATVSPDGTDFAFAKQSASEVWLASADGSHPHRLIAAPAKRAISYLLWSLDGKRLFVSSHQGGDRQEKASSTAAGTRAEIPEEWFCDSIEVASGKLLDHEAGVRIDSAFLLPDGQLKYVTGGSFASPDYNIRLMSVFTDLHTGRFLTRPRDEVNLPGTRASGVSATRDGSKVAMLLDRLKADIFTASLLRSQPRGMPALSDVHRVTQDVYDSFPHAWRPDGTILYETSVHAGTAILAKSPDQSIPEVLATLAHTAAMPQLTPDEKWILFLTFAGPQQAPDAIYRMAVNGGTPVAVPTPGAIEEIHCATLSSGRCVLRETSGHEELLYYDFDPIRGRGALLAKTAWEPVVFGDWSLSPDGRTVAWAGHDARHPGIHIVKLDESNTTQLLPFRGLGSTQGVHWSTDEQGLFIESRTERDYELVYQDLQGQATVLRTSQLPIWAVPSPDGKSIAFPDYTTNTNVWIADFQPVR